MEEDMVNMFSKFRLKENEAEGIVIGGEDILSSKNECERSLLGKIWGHKAANFTGLKNTLNYLWCPKGKLKVVELSFNYFQFIFTDKEEKNRILLKRPWIFDNQFVVVQPWNSKLSENDSSFKSVQMWVQVRCLPHHWCSKEVGWKLGKLFRNCLNVIMLENGSKDGKILKLLVDVNLDKPLMRGANITLEDEVQWVAFKYEQLPLCCFYCGIVGHHERSCEHKMNEAKEGSVCEGQYGEWLRASSPIRRKKGVIGEGVSRNQLSEDGGQVRKELGNIMQTESEKEGTGNRQKEVGEIKGREASMPSEFSTPMERSIMSVGVKEAEVQIVCPRIGTANMLPSTPNESDPGKSPKKTAKQLNLLNSQVDDELLTSGQELKVEGDRRPVLALVDQNVLRCVSGEDEVSSKPEPGRWKRLARTVHQDKGMIRDYDMECGTE